MTFLRELQVSKETETDANPSAKPERQITQRFPKSPGLIALWVRDKSRGRFGRTDRILNSTRAGDGRNGLSQERNSPRQEHPRRALDRICFCNHSGMNLHPATDNPMSGDFLEREKRLRSSSRLGRLRRLGFRDDGLDRLRVRGRRAGAMPLLRSLAPLGGVYYKRSAPNVA